MSVEQHQQQQQQLTAIELTKSNNNNNNNNSTATNNNTGNNLSSANTKNTNELKHNNDIINFHKAKEETLEKSSNSPPTAATEQPALKQNGQHYTTETNGGEHVKFQVPALPPLSATQRYHYENSKETKDQKDLQGSETTSTGEEKSRQLRVDSDNEGSPNDDDEDEGSSLSTACIIKSPLNKTLLKKCTPNGNGNLATLTPAATCCCNHGRDGEETPLTTDKISDQDQILTSGGDDGDKVLFDPFTKIPIPTTSSTPTTTITNQASIKCTKCNNNNNIHYNNYNCYYRKKAARLKPSICR